MADLSRPDDARGQILLVTALILGVSFVALALILNSAIFTENLASRGDTTGADEVVTYHNNLHDGIGAIHTYETHNASTSDDHGSVLGRIETGVSDADGILAYRHAKRGVVSNASIVDLDNGSRIFQTSYSRNFSDGDGDSDWTVAADVDATRAFEMNVSRASLPSSCTLFSNCFTMNVTDGSDDWRVSVNDTTSGIEVRVDNGSVKASCDPVAEPFVTVDVTGGTVNGTECSALNVSEAPSSSYGLEFYNGDEIEGTYSLVVDNETIAEPTVPALFNTGSGPTVTAAVYDLTIGYEYRTSEIVVEKEFRVAPGEPDGR